MKKKRFERTQRDNPHQLTIDQHVFPVRSIERFADKDGTVYVCLKSRNTSFRTLPNNEIFCAKRAWDQQAESGYMKEIENSFQPLADAIIKGDVLEIGPDETRKINDFWILWHLRAEHRDGALPDAKLNAISGDPSLDKNQQEQLEKLHIGYIRSDATIPGRNITGFKIQTRLFMERKLLANEKWGITKAREGEFIVPDVFLNRALIIPLAPTCCLISRNDNATVTREVVQKINNLAITYSRDYYFARDISACPV